MPCPCFRMRVWTHFSLFYSYWTIITKSSFSKKVTVGAQFPAETQGQWYWPSLSSSVFQVWLSVITRSLVQCQSLGYLMAMLILWWNIRITLSYFVLFHRFKSLCSGWHHWMLGVKPLDATDLVGHIPAHGRSLPAQAALWPIWVPPLLRHCSASSQLPESEGSDFLPLRRFFSLK